MSLSGASLKPRSSSFLLELSAVFLRGSGSRRIGLSAVLGLTGVALGVACLTVAMAVVSGFETTLKNSLREVSGDLLIVKRDGEASSLSEIEQRLEREVEGLVAVTPTLVLEGVLVGAGRVQGIALQGLDPQTVHRVLRLRERVLEGDFELAPGSAVIGKALRDRFQLGIGDEFPVVVPTAEASSDGFEESGFGSLSRRTVRLKVAGIVDLGKADFDERMVFVGLDPLRSAIGFTAPFSAVRVRLKQGDLAPSISLALKQSLGRGWFIMDWTEGSRNLFRAIEYERVPIFVVILMMIIAASFNVSANLWIGVIRRTKDIAILRTLGMRPSQVVLVFLMQGLLYGLIGSGLGLLLGVALSHAFVALQQWTELLPSSVYRLSSIGVDLRLKDTLWVVGSTLGLCLLASIQPARKAARLSPVEGVRHES